MDLRILGAHNFESRDTRMASYIIDGVIALDAGGLTRSLTFDEQLAVEAVILSHRHFDHIRDLFPFGVYKGHSGSSADVFAIEDTMNSVLGTLLNTSNSPDFEQWPSPDRPTFRYHTIDFYTEFEVVGYTVKAVPVPHSAPAAGIQITDGRLKLFYTGDTGKKLSDAWQHVSPDVLLTEVTYGDDNEMQANSMGHLTPRLLGECLHEFKATHSYLPKVIASHINPPWEEQVRQGLKELSQDLGIEITVAEHDRTMKL